MFQISEKLEKELAELAKEMPAIPDDEEYDEYCELLPPSRRLPAKGDVVE